MRRTEFELCHGEKGYHEMERFALDFPADCLGEAFLFISRFLAMLYIYSGENVCGYITFILFIPSPSCAGCD